MKKDEVNSRTSGSEPKTGQRSQETSRSLGSIVEARSPVFRAKPTTKK
jgi:hypothetical protein